jgi:SEFIR domain
MQKVSVFISYSHDSEEHRSQVLELSERLRKDGIETFLDQYVNGTPNEGWPRWMLNQIDVADSVLVVCTEIYYRRFRGHEVPGKGKGADWEGARITQEIYDARSSTVKFIPVFLSAANEQAIPEPLRSATHYALTSEEAYDSLYDFLLGQAGVQPGVIGELKRKPRVTGQPLDFGRAKILESANVSSLAPAPPSLVRADISRIDKYAPAELIGREAETQLLSDAWDKAVRGEANRPRVLTFVALGGEGKTSLVAKWAANLAHQDWLGCDAVFAWSFYSQGTRDQTAASSDLFLSEALTFFGDLEMAQSSQSAFDKGRRLARLIGERRALLILDGVEPLQYASTSPTPGELKDAGLSALLKGLAANNRGLCVVTSRYSIPDLKAYWQTTAPMHELKRLSTDAGVDLLQKLGVKNGSRKDFETLVEDVKGHALTLNLLGGFLKRAFKGDIRQRDRVKFEKADDKIQGGHAFRTMAAYEQWLLTGGEEGHREVAILRLMGLFDRPADARSLEALRSESIPDLTESLFSLDEDDWEFSLTGLEEAKLITVSRDAGGKMLALDAHPLLREYFAKQLRTKQPEAWRAAHRRIYEHLCKTTQEGDQPTLEDLQPLYQAVAHGCLANLHQRTFDDVYAARISRRLENYGTQKLGAFGAALGALACFFDTPWSHVSPDITEKARALLPNQAAFCLHAMGRLTEALEPMRVSGQVAVKAKDWLSAAISHSNLSGLRLTLGDVAGAVLDANQSVAYADENWRRWCGEVVLDANQPMEYFERISALNRQIYSRTAEADALHHWGHRAHADSLFREAEEMHGRLEHDYPQLYGVAGYQYCDLLLAAPARAAWQCTLGNTGFEPAACSIGSAPSREPEIDWTISPGEAATYGAAQDGRCRGQRVHEVECCSAVFARVEQSLQWRQTDSSLPLLHSALNQLTLGRAALYKAILTGSITDPCHKFIQHAVDELRRSGQQHNLPHGLLTRAMLRSLTGAITGPESAQSDLDEAWEIAERGPMPLFLADIHLHRARLFGRLKSEASGEKYPWESPAADLAAARQLIEKHGYWRRKEELEDAEAAAKTW